MSAPTPQGAVLAVDPGSDKCGLALVSAQGTVALLEVVPRSALAERVRELGAVVVAATALVDRSPAVAERFAEAGIRWDPLLTWVDLGIEAL